MVGRITHGGTTNLPSQAEEIPIYSTSEGGEREGVKIGERRERFGSQKHHPWPLETRILYLYD